LRRRVLILLATYMSLLIVLGMAVTPPGQLLPGLRTIVTSPSILISDYMALAGMGPALVNAGLVALIGVALAAAFGATSMGMVIAAVFTMAGFALFGKNVFNIWPGFLGVFLYHRIARRPMSELITPLLFGTTLAPIVSQVAFGFRLGAWGIVAGVVAGLMTAAMASHILTIHLGYNLFNIGLTGGFVSLFFYVLFKAFGLQYTGMSYWSTDYTGILTVVLGAMAVSLMILGWRWGASAEGMRSIMSRSGKLTTDYVEIAGIGSTLVNMGIMGLICLSYVHLVRGPISGPVAGAILTLTGFGALGAHAKNSVPVMLGVFLMSLPTTWKATDPGPLLAALFCIGLCPLAGRFGFAVGVLAGMVHLPLMMQTAASYGWMNLYNNGYAGALVAMLIVALMKGLKPELLADKP
jgi:hypothetical protein